MVATVERLDKKMVKIKYKSETRETQYDRVCHSPGRVDQANLFIIAKAIEWKAENLDIVCSEGEISEIMMLKAKSVFPYRGTIEIHVPKEEKDVTI